MPAKRKLPAVEVLAIVDMQVNYSAARSRDLIERIEAEALAVMERAGRVVVLSYDGQGEQTVRLPAGVPVLFKGEDDGGWILYAWLVGAGLLSRNLRLRFAGVNLSACVINTATRVSLRLTEDAALPDLVEIDLSLCGDNNRGRVRFVGTTEKWP